jgi:hypothetical protein
VTVVSGATIGELRDRATAEMRERVDQQGSARSDGDISAIVAFVDAYAWSKADGGMFDAKQFALWRLLQDLVPTAKAHGWDAVRSRVTSILEGSGCWERIGGERGSQWWLRRRWGTDAAEIPEDRPPGCRRQDDDGLCRDGWTDPRFCARCARS